MEAIKLSRVSKYYQQGDQVSVGMKNISLSFSMGEFVAVTGESGSGKSTLLNVISGLDKYEDGEMFIFGEETSHFQVSDFEKYRREYVGFVFQNYNIIDSYSVFQNVMLALELQNYDASKRKARALELISLVGLDKQKYQKSSKLSGGQKQRAVIARALAKDTPILVCDEPTGNLDQTSAKSIIELLHEVSKNKLVIIVTHEYDQVADYATRRIKMSDGDVVEDKKLKKIEDITEKPQVNDTKTSFFQILKFAFRNLFAQPRRFVFMLLLLTIAVGVFTVVYSNQMYNLRTQGLEQSSVFPSVPASRILIERRDGEALSNEDQEMINSYSGVTFIYEYGALFYNNSRFMMTNDANELYNYTTSYFDFADTAMMLNDSDLLEGRLPETENEIVVSLNYWSDVTVGDTYFVYLDNNNYYDSFDESSNRDYILEAEVVGIVSSSNPTIYFSHAYLSQAYPTVPTEDQTLKNQVIQAINNSMQMTFDGISYTVYPGYFDQNYEVNFDIYGENSGNIQTGTATFTAKSLNGITLIYTTEITYRSSNVEFGYAELSSMFYAEIINNFLTQVQSEYVAFPSRIASVSIENQFTGTKLIDTLDSDTFKVYYPSNLSSPFQSFIVFMLAIVAIVVLLLLGLFLYAVIHAVTRNMMRARTKDFSIFRSVGAHQQTLSFLVIIEQIILSLLGLVIAVGLLQVIIRNVDNHGLTIEYMRFIDYVLLTLAIMYLGTWLGLRFNKKVFKQTVIQALSEGGDDV